MHESTEKSPPPLAVASRAPLAGSHPLYQQKCSVFESRRADELARALIARRLAERNIAQQWQYQVDAAEKIMAVREEAARVSAACRHHFNGSTKISQSSGRVARQQCRPGARASACFAASSCREAACSVWSPPAAPPPSLPLPFPYPCPHPYTPRTPRSALCPSCWRSWRTDRRWRRSACKGAPTPR